MLVSQEIFLSLFSSFLSAWLSRWQPRSAFMQAAKTQARFIMNTFTIKQCNPYRLAVTCCVAGHVLFPTLCACHQSEDKMERCAWKLSKETAKLKPVRRSSPTMEERAPPEGKKWGMWLFMCLHRIEDISERGKLKPSRKRKSCMNRRNICLKAVGKLLYKLWLATHSRHLGWSCKGNWDLRTELLSLSDIMQSTCT